MEDSLSHKRSLEHRISVRQNFWLCPWHAEVAPNFQAQDLQFVGEPRATGRSISLKQKCVDC